MGATPGAIKENTEVAKEKKETQQGVEFTPIFKRNFELSQISGHGLDLPPECYILMSPSLEEILFNRGLVGYPLQLATYRAARTLFEALKDNLMGEYPPTARFEQVNLAGSDFYQLPSAHAKIYNSGLPRNYVALHREKILGGFDEENRQLFKTEINYTRFEAKGKLLLIGETVATGISAVDAFKIHLPFALEHGLETILLFSIAGSKIGAQRIYQTLRRYNTNTGQPLRIIFVFGLGLFGLGKDGTAITWRSEDSNETAITLPFYQLKGDRIFLPGECIIGDWGKRFTDSVGYLGDWLEELKGFGHPERFNPPPEYRHYFFS